MFLKLGELDLLSFLLDLLGLGLLDGIPIVKPVAIGVIEIDSVALLWFTLAVVVNFKESTLNLFAVHFHQSLLGTLM